MTKRHELHQDIIWCINSGRSDRDAIAEELSVATDDTETMAYIDGLIVEMAALKEAEKDGTHYTSRSTDEWDEVYSPGQRCGGMSAR